LFSWAKNSICLYKIINFFVFFHKIHETSCTKGLTRYSTRDETKEKVVRVYWVFYLFIESSMQLKTYLIKSLIYLFIHNLYVQKANFNLQIVIIKKVSVPHKILILWGIAHIIISFLLFKGVQKRGFILFSFRGLIFSDHNKINMTMSLGCLEYSDLVNPALNKS